MKRAAGLLLVAAAALVAAGCARPTEVRFPNPMPLPTSDRVTVEQVARRVLLELRFELVYPASKEGRVVTEALTGDSWFEFWRGDTVGAFQRVESSLHTVRRTASVTVAPEGPGAQLAVKVTKERLSAPNLSPQSIGQTYDIFSPSKTDLARWDEFKETRYAWLPMGRDDALEQQILQRILARLGSAMPR
ncbi:MAG: hypothetical protein FJ288_06050 [Planctomycetes bacterium]|nr:hypothetical protein [Planctomycetota bacterium]